MSLVPRTPAHPLTRIWRTYLTPALLTILAMGFFSGLPLGLTGATLSYWLADENVERGAIGLFGAAATPYALKFLWAPFMDSLSLPFLTRRLGRRRSWMLTSQIALTVAIAFLALTSPALNPWMTALAALLVAFSSASQDIVIDAYRVERLTPVEQGEGAAMAQLGYNIGMIVAGAGALKLAGKLGWPGTYMVMAGIMAIGGIITILAREPHIPAEGRLAGRNFALWLREAVIAPFANFTRHSDWWLILTFIIIFKFADAFIGRMTSPFFHDMQFNKDDIANIVKIYGTLATLAGVFTGGALTRRYGSVSMLFVAGFLHALTNLLYVEQARLGADTHFLAASIAVENFTGGISAAAFVAYLSGLCNVHYTATQYALLSSLAAFGRTWLSTPAGYAARYLGWQWFFTLSALLALPGLIVLYCLQRRIGTRETGTMADGT